MRKHARHIATGGVVAPTAFAAATVIGNETQTLLGLGLHGLALAVYLVPFLLGSAHVLQGQLRLEAQALMSDSGGLLSGLGDLLGGGMSPVAGEDSPAPKPGGVIPPGPPQPIGKPEPPPPPPPMSGLGGP